MPGAMIYGATGGVGSGVARRLAASGWQLHLVAREPARLGALADELGAGRTTGDARAPESFERAAAAWAAQGPAPEGPPLDALIYAVGDLALAPLGRVDDAQALASFELHALGALRAVRASRGALARAERGASVVLFSSVAVGLGFAAHAAIAMAKGAVEGLVRALASELAPAIRVNALAPSLTLTPLGARVATSPSLAASLAEQHALRRLGQPDDLVGAVEFLVGPGARWVTGQVWAIDGGRSRIASRR